MPSLSDFPFLVGVLPYAAYDMGKHRGLIVWRVAGPDSRGRVWRDWHEVPRRAVPRWQERRELNEYREIVIRRRRVYSYSFKLFAGGRERDHGEGVVRKMLVPNPHFAGHKTTSQVRQEAG